MKFKTEALAATAAITAAAIFTLCTGVLAAFPAFFQRLWTNAWHLGVTSGEADLTWTSYVLGLCFWVVGAYAVFAIAGWTYNRLSARRIVRISFPSVET